jgi:hypothetical protein
MLYTLHQSVDNPIKYNTPSIPRKTKCLNHFLYRYIAAVELHQLKYQKRMTP